MRFWLTFAKAFAVCALFVAAMFGVVAGLWWLESVTFRGLGPLVILASGCAAVAYRVAKDSA